MDATLALTLNVPACGNLHLPGSPFAALVPETDVRLAAVVFGLDLVAVEFRVVRAQHEVAPGVGAIARVADRRTECGLRLRAGDLQRGGELGNLLRRERHDQAIGGLLPFEFARSSRAG